MHIVVLPCPCGLDNTLTLLLLRAESMLFYCHAVTHSLLSYTVFCSVDPQSVCFVGLRRDRMFPIYTEYFFSVELTFALSLTGLLSHLGSNICKTQDHSHSDTTPLYYIYIYIWRDTVKNSKAKNRVYIND